MTKANLHLKVWFILLLTLTIPSFPFADTGEAHAALPDGKQKGMTFAAWWPGEYSTPDADQALAELKDDGPNWLALIVTRYQDTIASTAIYSAPGTPTDEDLVHVINQAHSLGMKVMLKPHLDLANDPSHWRGDIGQGFSESDWTAWFSSYKTFINHYAQLAQTYGADQFCVGTELVSTEFRSADWQSVIAGVRGLFTGPITYAANPGSETSINWWDKVDAIGVDAYYALTDHNDPTLDELKAAWEPLAAALKTLSENWGKPILFTEIGYPSLDGANRQPWNGQVSKVVDLQEQADLYQALFETFFNQDWFAGVFWWSWETDPLQGGPCDTTDTPHDKPAEAVLRTWYGAPPKPASTEVVPGLDYTRTMAVYTDQLGAGWESWSWDGTYDFASTEQVAGGAYAISAVADPGGALALHHDNFDSSPYYWLELYVYKSTDASPLMVWANDENDNPMRDRPVEDCRYTQGRPFAHEIWTRVRIPLKDLQAGSRLLQRVSIGNRSDQAFTFYVDDVRLVGALWSTFLPLTLKR
jgi:hypothetical protein